MIGRSTLTALLVVGAALTATAQDDLSGVWKRSGDTDRFYVVEKSDKGYTGKLVNPPFESMSVSLELTQDGDKVRGQCNWTEKVEDQTYETHTKWDFKASGDTLEGRAEAIDWEGGVVYHREWVAYTLERVQPKGLVTEGEASDESFGDEIESLATLAGGWKGAGGAWAATVEGEELVLTAVGHREGTTIRLKNERGTLRGQAKMGDGSSGKVELGFSEGALSGKSSWSAGPVEGWAPIEFKRVERAEAGAEAPTLTPGSGELAGVWKRDDGLYLRVRKTSEGVSGVLSDKTGKVSARITFTEAEGIWTGTVNWGDYETKWELSVGEGALTARCQWADTHEGKLVATGWGGRTFKALKRVH